MRASIVLLVGFAVVFIASFSRALGADDSTEAIRRFLHDNIDANKGVGMVVGLVDERGNKVICHGKLGNGTDQEVSGDTVFEIGSITKTFTALLLQDVVERGEMMLDDPVAKYLPNSVKMPSKNGKDTDKTPLHNLRRFTRECHIVGLRYVLFLEGADGIEPASG